MAKLLEQLERDCRTMIKYVVEKPESFVGRF